MRWWPPWPTPPDASAPRRHLPRLRRALRAEALLAAGLACLTAALYLGGLFERLELIAIDHRYRAFPAPLRPDILLVLIDSASLRRVPEQWPWPRFLHARIVRRLHAAGARAIGYDMEFGRARDPEGDAALAAAVAEARNVVLAVFREQKTLPDGTEVYPGTPLMPELRVIGAAAGTISFHEDPAGGIRRAPLREEVVGDPYWAFALEVVRLAEQLPPDRLRWVGPAKLQLGDRVIQGDRIVQGARLTPIDIVYIDYAGGRGTFPSVSAVDVLEGHVRPADVRGKVVLVGASAIELQDLHPSPFPGVLPGVEIQANLVNGFLRGAAARRLPPWVTLVVLAVLAVAWPRAAARVASGPARVTTRALRLVAAAGVAVAGLAALAAVLFWQWRIFLDVVPPVALAAGMGVATLVVEGLRTGRRAALSTVALASARPDAAVSPLDQAVDVLFLALRDGMKVEVLVLDLRRDVRRPGAARVTRTRGTVTLGPESPTCQGWAQRAFASGEGVLASALGEVFRGAPGVPAVRAAGSAFVPLVVGGKGTGVLQVHRADAPFEPDDLRVLSALAAQLALTVQNLDLVHDLHTLYLGSMAALADAVEARDAYTGGHCKRVSDYSVRLAQAAGVPASEVEEIRFGSLIHDIGKIGIADGILGKASGLTEEEWGQMKTHTLIGERIVAQLPVSQTVRDIILYHHERYNGSGYPRGLSGEAIPIAARIVAIADAYEALTSGRVYRAPLPAQGAVAALRKDPGTHLDPHLVELFVGLLGAGSGPAPSPPAAER